MALLTSCNKNNDSFSVFTDFSDAFPSDIIKADDGGFFISGWGRSSNFYSSTNGLVFKLDSEGNRDWAKEFGTNDSYDKFNFIVSLDNGDYLLGGNQNSNVWLIKINSNGDVISEQMIVNSYSETAEAACFDSVSKTLFIVGNTNQTGEKKATIFIADNNGKVNNQILLQSYQNHKIFSCNIDPSDSTLIVTGYKYVNAVNGKDGLFMKIDMNGNIVWEKTYGESGGEILWDSEIDFEGNYVLSGTSSLSISGTSALILKINKMGDILYSKHINNLPNSAAKKVLRKTDDSIVIIGRMGDFSGHSNNNLLILNLKKNSDFESHKILAKNLGIEGKIFIETLSGELLVSGSTNQRKIYTMKIND